MYTIIHRTQAITDGNDNAAGNDTQCDPTLCSINEYVFDHTCTACPGGTTNTAGNDASGPNTECVATLCNVDEYVLDHVCTACPAGKTNTAGDDASGPNTECISTLCNADEYVLNQVKVQFHHTRLDQKEVNLYLQ